MSSLLSWKLRLPLLLATAATPLLVGRVDPVLGQICLVAFTAPVTAMLLASPLLDILPVINRLFDELYWWKWQGRCYNFQNTRIRMHLSHDVPHARIQDILHALNWVPYKSRLKRTLHAAASPLKDAPCPVIGLAGLREVASALPEYEVVKLEHWFSEVVAKPRPVHQSMQTSVLAGGGLSMGVANTLVPAPQSYSLGTPRRSYMTNPGRYARKASSYRVEFATEAGEIASIRATICHEAGDALLEGLHGEVLVMPGARLSSEYDPVPPTTAGMDGLYSNRPAMATARQADRDCIVHLPEGRGHLEVWPGDWIVHTDRGETLVLPDHAFHKAFMPI